MAVDCYGDFGSFAFICKRAKAVIFFAVISVFVSEANSFVEVEACPLCTSSKARGAPLLLFLGLFALCIILNDIYWILFRVFWRWMGRFCVSLVMVKDGCSVISVRGKKPMWEPLTTASIVVVLLVELWVLISRQTHNCSFMFTYVIWERKEK